MARGACEDAEELQAVGESGQRGDGEEDDLRGARGRPSGHYAADVCGVSSEREGRER